MNAAGTLLLVAGALVSLLRRIRVGPNAAILAGVLVIAVAGTFTRFGYTEVLYVTEFIGLGLIFMGYRTVVGRPPYLASSQAMDAISPSA